MQELLIATKNPGKYREITEILTGLPLRTVFLGEVDVFGGPEEDGETFRENAYKKARYFFERTGKAVLAEDSGVLVEAMEGELGLKTRRWGLGEDSDDEEWIRYFLERMEGVSNRSAAFVCSACFFSGDEPVFFDGETKGHITDDLQAPLIPGIPLSSCFIPEGMEKVYAALSVEEKNKVSHRGKALSGVRTFLRERM